LIIINAQYYSKNTCCILVLVDYRQEAVCKFTLVR